MTLTVEEKAHALYRGVALAPMVRASTTPLHTLEVLQESRPEEI
jgi:hypothetical protein